jgi:hypothetical protein
VLVLVHRHKQATAVQERRSPFPQELGTTGTTLNGWYYDFLRIFETKCDELHKRWIDAKLLPVSGFCGFSA